MILMMGSLTTGTVNLSQPREELSTPASRLDIVWAEATFTTSSAAFISFVSIGPLDPLSRPALPTSPWASGPASPSPLPPIIRQRSTPISVGKLPHIPPSVGLTLPHQRRQWGVRSPPHSLATSRPSLPSSPSALGPHLPRPIIVKRRLENSMGTLLSPPNILSSKSSASSPLFHVAINAPAINSFTFRVVQSWRVLLKSQRKWAQLSKHPK